MFDVLYTKWVASQPNDTWGHISIIWETLIRNTSSRVFRCPIHPRKLFKTVSGKGFWGGIDSHILGAVTTCL